jgi:hypothetical protein
LVGFISIFDIYFITPIVDGIEQVRTTPSLFNIAMTRSRMADPEEVSTPRGSSRLFRV